MNFAIVDIETTGGNPKSGEIIEIAIVISNGIEVVNQFESLVRPNGFIPKFITNLTGISTPMVMNAPTFHSIAKTVHSLLKDCIFVAHNAQFDYSFVSKQLEECGLFLPKQNLCTVKYTRKLIPGLKSYALGAVSTYFHFINKSAHRAMGDTEVTTQILHELLKMDRQEEWRDLVFGKKRFVLPPQIEESTFHHLPTETGVYFIQDTKGTALYIGKAKNIKSRITQHFTEDHQSKKYQGLYKNAAKIAYILTQNEIMALILEDIQIRKYWPEFNSAQKTNPVFHHISAYQDQEQNWRLAIVKGKKTTHIIESHFSLSIAREALHLLMKEHPLRYSLSPISQNATEEANTLEAHNNCIENLLKTNTTSLLNGLIWLTTNQEKRYHILYIEGNQIVGYGLDFEKVEQSIEASQINRIKPSSFLKYYLSTVLKHETFHKYIPYTLTNNLSLF